MAEGGQEAAQVKLPPWPANLNAGQLTGILAQELAPHSGEVASGLKYPHDRAVFPMAEAIPIRPVLVDDNNKPKSALYNRPDRSASKRIPRSPVLTSSSQF